MKRQRLDKALVLRGLASSRDQARALILDGAVVVDGIVSTKAARQVDGAASIVLRADQPAYVSRGGLKLEQAIRAFSPAVEGCVAIDIGASTGGFTDCLLQHGAAKVYAVDVGYGQLAWKLRTDPRVVVLERVNIRAVTAEHLPEPLDLAVVDCSFIGLEKVVRPAVPYLREHAELLALVKPQFEVGPAGVGKGGVVRDSSVRAAAIARVEDELRALGFALLGGVDCETHGPAGNVEYLVHARLERATPVPASGSSGGV